VATPIPFLISAVRINIYSPAFFDVQSNIYREVKKSGYYSKQRGCGIESEERDLLRGLPK
jgi:hypothetical protein